MRLVIDIPDYIQDYVKHSMPVKFNGGNGKSTLVDSFYYIVKGIESGVQLHDNITNGDVIRLVYKPYRVLEILNYVYVYETESDFKNDRHMMLPRDYWISSYKEEVKKDGFVL